MDGVARRDPAHGTQRLSRRLLAWVFRSPVRTRASMVVLPLMNVGRLPLLGRRFPWTAPAKNNIRYLPVNISLAMDDAVLPHQVIHHFIDRAGSLRIMDFCGCRRARDCEHYPRDIGCLFMGSSALDIPKDVSHAADRGEAHAHVERAVAAGLVPLIGKVRVDNFIFLTPDRGRLLSVCFCCHCCCMMRSYKGVPALLLDRVIRPLEGVAITLLSDRCVGCGTCVATCPFDAIRIVDGKAVHTEACRRCGRCERFCPNHAVAISWDSAAFPANVIGSIESMVDVR
jgi:UDP-glucose 4-epimerase